MLTLMLTTLLAAIGPLEPIPSGLEDAVRAIDTALPRESGSTRDYVSDLLHLSKRGEQSALDRLRGVPNGVLCFWLDSLITFAEGAAGDGARIHAVVQRLHTMYGDNCRGPGGKAAETEHALILSKFIGALNDMRVAVPIARMLHGTPYDHLSPQAMRSLPAGPPVAGAPNARVILMVVIVAIGAAIPTPEEAITWPLLYQAMATQ